MRILLSSIAVLSLLTAPGAMQTARQIVRVGASVNAPFSPAVRAGNFIYLSGTLATDSAGKITGDIKAQTRRVLENLAVILKAAGSRMENVLSVTVYLRNAADFQAMNEIYRGYWPKDPPVRTTVAANLVLQEALIEISMIAVPDGGERRIVHPEGWIRPASPYSYGIRSADTLFLAGLISRRGKDNSVVPGDITSQTRTVMDNAGEILKAGGMGLADVASSRVYLTDTSMFQDMNAAYRAYFPKDPPARATVRAGLMNPEALLEITLLAVQGATRNAILPPNADGSPAQTNPNLSAAIRTGNRLFLSGMLGNEAGNKGDAKGQTRATLARVARTLKAAGFDWKDVVDGTVYITDIRNFVLMNEAYREIFTGDFPARATVETGLVSPDGLVEIMFTAVK